MLGKGTVNNRILDFFGITDIRKEIVLMVADKKTATKTVTKLDKDFKFEKPNHGIAFTTFVCDVIGASCCKNDNLKEGRGVDNTMYQAIITIVDKGKAEYVINAANAAGSKGGTIINGRGSGIHETAKLFSMEIEPEKEIVLILSKRERTESIINSIREQLKIDDPGKGIIFIQDVNKTYGLYE